MRETGNKKRRTASPTPEAKQHEQCDEVDAADEQLLELRTPTQKARTSRVVVGPSTICDGLGLFAAADAPAGTFLTGYGGANVSRVWHEKALCARRAAGIACGDDFLMQLHDGDGTVDGFYATVHCTGERPADAAALLPGFAQYANDALHESLTGRSVNCEFREVRRRLKNARCGSTFPRVYLVATADVRAGDELFASYCLQYWLYKATHEPDRLPADTLDWLLCQARIEREVFWPGKMEDFQGVRLVEERPGHLLGVARYLIYYPRGTPPAVCSCSFSGSASGSDVEDHADSEGSVVSSMATDGHAHDDTGYDGTALRVNLHLHTRFLTQLDPDKNEKEEGDDEATEDWVRMRAECAGCGATLCSVRVPLGND